MKYLKKSDIKKQNDVSLPLIEMVNTMSDEEFELFLESASAKNTKKNPIYSTDDDGEYTEFWKQYFEKKDREENEYDEMSKNIIYRSDNINKDFKDMSILEKFIDLTKYTYILGQEHELEYIFPSGIQKDVIGNYYMTIGSSDVMFTSHLDTATSKKVKVNHIVENEDDDTKQIFVKSDGRTILGGDDKAGVIIMLHMIENNVPGLYYFFIGEEKGTVGSSGILDANPSFFDDYKKCISFDRRAYGSVITKQMGTNCCSSEFAQALVNELSNKTGTPFKEDPTGVYTDSAVFMDIIPECTNISVGYFSEHTHQESQNITYLEWLCAGVLNINWNSLPVQRDPEEEFKKYYKNLQHKKSNTVIVNKDVNKEYVDVFNVIEEVMADVFNMECLNGAVFSPNKEMYFEDWNNEEHTMSVYIYDDLSITIGKSLFDDLYDLEIKLKEYYDYDLSKNSSYYYLENGDDEDYDEDEDEDSDIIDGDKFGEGNWDVIDGNNEDDDEQEDEPFELGISVKNFMTDVKTDLLEDQGKYIPRHGYISAGSMQQLLLDYGKTIPSLITWLYKKNNDPTKTMGLIWDDEKDKFWFQEDKFS